MPTPQDPPRAPDERLGTEAVLREAHSRLAELLLAAASILAEISTSGGAGTSADFQQGRPGDSHQNDWGIPALSTARPSFGGNGEHHVAAVLQARSLTLSTRAADRHQTPAIGAAISHTDGAAERNHEAEDAFIFQQRLMELVLCLGTDSCRPPAAGSSRRDRSFQARSAPSRAAGATGRSSASRPIRRTGQADSR
ncbi:unnamed protein product [Lampetra fluviatilis]